MFERSLGIDIEDKVEEKVLLDGGALNFPTRQTPPTFSGPSKDFSAFAGH